MGNTKTLVKTLATGIPLLADMVDNEIVWVTDSEVLYKRVDASTLISNSGFTDAKVAAAPSVVLNTAKESPTKTNIEAVLTGELTSHSHPLAFGIGASGGNSYANIITSGSHEAIVDSGLYYIGNSVTAKPTSNGGQLIVNNNQSSSNNNYIKHIFSPYDSNDLYVKSKINGTWDSAWDKLMPYKSYTVATLPTGSQGDVAYVTDALTPSYLSTVVGGGAVVCPVFYDGTNWVCH